MALWPCPLVRDASENSVLGRSSKLPHWFIDPLLLYLAYVCERAVSVLSKALEQWSSRNVLEWMAALNLYQYAHVFQRSNVDGQSLLTLDQHKLQVHLIGRHQLTHQGGGADAPKTGGFYWMSRPKMGAKIHPAPKKTYPNLIQF